MKKALADDLESAKWLMGYFSDPAHKDYAEAKKWFGRALGIGAKAADLRLPGGYDEPYLVTATHRLSPLLSVRVTSSCDQVDNQWRPLCYSQRVNFFPTDSEGNDVSSDQNSAIDSGRFFVEINNPLFHQHLALLTRIKFYSLNYETLVALESKNMQNNVTWRYDYFLIELPVISEPLPKEPDRLTLVDPRYLGSEPPDENLYDFHMNYNNIENFSKNLGRLKNQQVPLLPEYQAIREEMIAKGECIMLDVTPYPASAMAVNQ